MLENPHVLLTFDKVHNPLRLPRKRISERPKVLRTRQFFAILTSKCASRHNGVHFFDISTSKSGPNMVCFVHLTSKCASPQHFFDIQLPKAVRTCGVFYIFTSKCALRHNDVQFLISHLASWLRRFSEPTFRPSGATNHWKKQCFATFLPFCAPGSSFF